MHLPLHSSLIFSLSSSTSSLSSSSVATSFSASASSSENKQRVSSAAVVLRDWRWSTLTSNALTKARLDVAEIGDSKCQIAILLRLLADCGASAMKIPQVYENILSIICSGGSDQSHQQQQQQQQQQQRTQPIVVDLPLNWPIFSCSAHFTAAAVSATKEMRVNVMIASHVSIPLEFETVTLLFNHPALNTTLTNEQLAEHSVLYQALAAREKQKEKKTEDVECEGEGSKGNETGNEDSHHSESENSKNNSSSSNDSAVQSSHSSSSKFALRDA